MLDFVDLGCLEENVKFAVENVAAMFLDMWRLCYTQSNKHVNLT